MLTLAELTDAQFDRYLETAIATYARDGARATGTPPDEALAFARSQITGLLSESRLTFGQHLRSLVTEAGEAVGTIWYAEQLEDDPPRVFLYDIRLAPERRGEGLGTEAMGMFEDEARRLGGREVKLHVFTHNDGAIRLYERLGYRIVLDAEAGKQMAKGL